MAVKKDTRQKLLFANDDLPIDGENSQQFRTWKRAASRQLAMLLCRTKSAIKTGWEKKSASVVSGIRTRSKSVNKNTVLVKKEITWNAAATMQFKRLKVKSRQFAWMGWVRKSASTAMGQGKRAKRLKTA